MPFNLLPLRRLLQFSSLAPPLEVAGENPLLMKIDLSHYFEVNVSAVERGWEVIFAFAILRLTDQKQLF